jgi:hypothetical protein
MRAMFRPSPEADRELMDFLPVAWDCLEQARLVTTGMYGKVPTIGTDQGDAHRLTLARSYIASTLVEAGTKDKDAAFAVADYLIARMTGWELVGASSAYVTYRRGETESVYDLALARQEQERFDRTVQEQNTAPRERQATDPP